tara:strand:+ start:3675 stop:4463 length:789 start_codon:yes stop_codon:yes gene_type:complete
MYTHNLDPILIDLGFLAIRWYSLAYIFGILLGWWYGKKIIRKLNVENRDVKLLKFDDLITYLIISVIIGGRLGYVIFYNFDFFVKNPLEILKVWEGGMSFHGALIGIIIGTYLFSAKNNFKTLFFLDIISCVAPIGIFFGRVANFVNGELVGKVTQVSWGVIFPNIDMMPRHPSQIYEAILEGIVLFYLMNVLIFSKSFKTGTCACFFLIAYGFFRIFSEIFREPDIQLGYFLNIFSMGMILSFIMILTGLSMFVALKKNEN